MLKKILFSIFAFLLTIGVAHALTIQGTSDEVSQFLDSLNTNDVFGRASNPVDLSDVTYSSTFVTSTVSVIGDAALTITDGTTNFGVFDTMGNDKGLTISNATTTFATTTTSQLNGTIVVDGVAYPQSGVGVDNATTDCSNDSSCSTVFFPCATYSFSAAIETKTGVNWRGENASCVTFQVANSADVGIVNNSSGTTYQDIIIEGITFDGNAANQTANSVQNLVALRGTQNQNIVFRNNRVINADKHALYFSDADHGWTGKNVAAYNEINNHGVGGVGYGIYADYAMNTWILYNDIIDSNGSDAIEMGNLGHIYAIGNYLEDGQLQFPFCDYCKIIGNRVAANTIQNDANTANFIEVIGNHVGTTTAWVTPSSGFGGISVHGASSTIEANIVFTDAESGITVKGGGGHAVKNNHAYGRAAIDDTDSVGIEVQTSFNRIEGNGISGYATGTKLVLDDNLVTGNTYASSTIGVGYTNSTVSGHVMLNNYVQGNNFTDNVGTPIQKNNQANASNAEPFNVGISGWYLDGVATTTDMAWIGTTAATAHQFIDRSGGDLYVSDDSEFDGQVFVDMGSNQVALTVDVQNTSADAVQIQSELLTSGDSLQITVDSDIQTGRAIKVLGGSSFNTEVFAVDALGRTTTTESLVVGNPTGGGLGTGSINAQNIYDDSVQVTDYVFDFAYDGKLKAEDQEQYPDFQLYTIDETEEFVEKERHLPSITGREDFEKKKFSTGELISQLWETIERIYLHIFQIDDRQGQLEKRIEVLEAQIEAIKNQNQCLVN